MTNPTRRYLSGTKIPDLTGEVFERLTVLEFVGLDSRRNAMWRCRCTCGGEVETRGSALRYGDTRSCGCLMRERTASLNRAHGQNGTPLHGVWSGMIQRCINPREVGYHRYGGRGITVCDRWRDSFEAFAQDMAGGYAPGLQIDRIDNDGSYEPGNCRWVTRAENMRNMSSNRHITFRGQTKILADWAKLLGLSFTTLKYRVDSGWTTERALTKGADPAALARLSDLSDGS